MIFVITLCKVEQMEDDPFLVLFIYIYCYGINYDHR